MAAHRTIERVEATEADLQVWLTGTAEPLNLPWIWVRDHSQDPSAVDPGTAQRTVDTFTLDPAPRPAAATVVDRSVHITWSDGSPTSILPDRLLAGLGAAAQVSSYGDGCPGASGVVPTIDVTGVLQQGWPVTVGIEGTPLTPGIVQRPAIMDADANLVCFKLLLAEESHIVGSHHRAIGVDRQINRQGVVVFFSFSAGPM